ncbi:MAG: hypothetical protein CSA38_01310 [Flavobacteriales bacterium]|nr:MAG: hypothetical protein CSA38_01310 [Flavobacteriales bacterium]
MKDIKLNNVNDLEIIGGDFVIGESELQEVGIILQLNQGELKSDPLCGMNMYKYIKGKGVSVELEKNLKIQLERDGKNYEKIKKALQLNKINE